MDNSSLPIGYTPVEKAIEYINTNTFDKPTVDIKWLVGHLDWIEVAHGFRIPKVRLATEKEYAEMMRKRPGRKPNELIEIGEINVLLKTAFEVEFLKKTIKDNFTKCSGREYQELHTRGMTSVIDQETGSGAAPRRTKKTVAKEGDVIGTGATISTNSAEGAGA